MGERIRVKYGKFYVPVVFDKELLTPPEDLPDTAVEFDECTYGCGTEVLCPMGHIRCRQCIFLWSDDEHKNAYRQWFKEQGK